MRTSLARGYLQKQHPLKVPSLTAGKLENLWHIAGQLTWAKPASGLSLGMAGFLLAYLMMFLGVLAATDSLVREVGPAGKGAKYIIPLTDIAIFATLIFFALRPSFGAQAP